MVSHWYFSNFKTWKSCLFLSFFLQKATKKSSTNVQVETQTIIGKPQAQSNKAPLASSSANSKPSLEFFQLPKKYQRKAITNEEADAINVNIPTVLDSFLEFNFF
jgi:hypothetical protein